MTKGDLKFMLGTLRLTLHLLLENGLVRLTLYLLLENASRRIDFLFVEKVATVLVCSNRGELLRNVFDFDTVFLALN